MRKLLTISTLIIPAMVGGCNSNLFSSLTPAQKAQLFCVLAADGTAIAVSSTKGGANATATTVQGASVTACNAATQVGQIVSAGH